MKKNNIGNGIVLREWPLKIGMIFFISISMVAVIGFEYYNKDIGKNVKAASEGCPSSEWIPVGDFCIMDDLLDDTDENWGESVYSCLDEKDARLCSVSEWVEACRLNEGGYISISDMETDGTDNYEWAGEIEDTDNQKAVIIGESGCGDIDSDDIKTGSQKRRCCINRERY